MSSPCTASPVAIFNVDVDASPPPPQSRIADAKADIFCYTEIKSEGERALVSPSLGALWESISAFTCVWFSAHTSLTLPPLDARIFQIGSFISISRRSLLLWSRFLSMSLPFYPNPQTPLLYMRLPPPPLNRLSTPPPLLLNTAMASRPVYPPSGGQETPRSEVDLDLGT